MSIHQLIKDTINEHKKKIELIQWAMMSGVSSLVYSEYIRRIKQKTVPTRCILVPEIKTVQEFLSPDGSFMQQLSDRLIHNMIERETFHKYLDAPELILFTDKYYEILKTIFDLYMIPNITRRIPESIAIKFQLNDPSQQLIRESPDIDLFERIQISEDYFQFVVEQCILQLLLLLPTMKKNLNIPEDNKAIHITENEILSIGNDNAICPIHFNDNIIQNSKIMELLSFVTSTEITPEIPRGNLTNLAPCNSNGFIYKYFISTSPFNQVFVITLEGIVINTEA